MNYIQIIITIIITAVITHYLTVYRERKQWDRTLELQKIQDYNKAAAVFRSEFTDILHELKKTNSPAPAYIKKVIQKHEKAIIQFKPYLSDIELKNIDIAWKKFAYDKNFPDVIEYTGEQYHADSISEKKKMRLLVIQRIEKLLECAKPK